MNWKTIHKHTEVDLQAIFVSEYVFFRNTLSQVMTETSSQTFDIDIRRLMYYEVALPFLYFHSYLTKQSSLVALLSVASYNLYE